MMQVCLYRTGLTLLIISLLAAGCSKSSPPTPLALEELPAAFEKAFSKGKPELKVLANEIVASVKAKDYPKAFAELQYLARVTDLTKEQATTMGRATITISELLQAAEAKGDEKATVTIENYRKTK